MTKRSHPTLRDSWICLLCASLVTLGGCCSIGGAARRGPGGGAAEGAGPLGKSALKCDVQMVVVLANGTTVPDRIAVRKDIQIVVWVADARKLDIAFAENPFPNPVRCEGGRFCASLLPANGSYKKDYKYTVTVVDARGVSHTNDPHLEVVP